MSLFGNSCFKQTGKTFVRRSNHYCKNHHYSFQGIRVFPMCFRNIFLKTASFSFVTGTPLCADCFLDEWIELFRLKRLCFRISMTIDDEGHDTTCEVTVHGQNIKIGTIRNKQATWQRHHEDNARVFVPCSIVEKITFTSVLRTLFIFLSLVRRFQRRDKIRRRRLRRI